LRDISYKTLLSAHSCPTEYPLTTGPSANGMSPGGSRVLSAEHMIV
jgi:hypothetical protein